MRQNILYIAEEGVRGHRKPGMIDGFECIHVIGSIGVLWYNTTHSSHIWRDEIFGYKSMAIRTLCVMRRPKGFNAMSNIFFDLVSTGSRQAENNAETRKRSWCKFSKDTVKHWRSPITVPYREYSDWCVSVFWQSKYKHCFLKQNIHETHVVALDAWKADSK